MRITANDKQQIEEIMSRVGGGPGMRGVLKSLFYWHGVSRQTGQKRMTQKRFGQLWVAKSANELGDEANVKGTTARKIIRKLAEAGIVERKQGIFGGRKVLFVRLIEDPYPVQAPNQSGQKYRIKPEMQSSVPVEYRTERSSVPVLKSGTEGRTFYDQVLPDTTINTTRTKQTKPHPQRLLAENWQKLKSLISQTCTERTIGEFSRLVPKALPAGEFVVYGECSEHLSRLIEAKFPGILFRAA